MQSKTKSLGTDTRPTPPPCIGGGERCQGAPGLMAVVTVSQGAGRALGGPQQTPHAPRAAGLSHKKTLRGTFGAGWGQQEAGQA